MKSSSHSITNSLKGRIWLAAASLAIVDCILGLAAYLILSFLSADPFLTLFVTCILLTLATLSFGWLISKDILKPVEELALLARSLERSPSASLPRTTGAIETDQLLQSLHKNGQQLRNLISVMDDVAAGKTEAATIPLEASDKLTASFQKLCTKVTDSISAKRELDELRTAVTQLSADVSKVRGGQVEVDPRSDHPEAKDLANTLRFLTGRLTSLYQQIFASTLECDRAAAEARSSLQSVLDSIDQTALNRVIGEVRSSQNSKLEAAVVELSAAVKTSSELYDEFSANDASTTRVVGAAQQLQQGAAETSHVVQKLRNRVSAISQLARNAKDISKRSNLIALNASIAANGNGTPEMLVSEIENVSARSEDLCRQIVLAGESLNSEIAAIEKGIASLTDVAPEIARSVNSSTQLVHTLFDQIVQIGEIEQNVRSASEETRLENDKLRGIIDKLSDVSVASAMVRESETGIQRISSLVTGLRESVSDLKVSSASRPQTSIPESSPVAAMPAPPSVQQSPSAQGSFEMLVESSTSGSGPEPTLAPLPPSVKFPASPTTPVNGFETLIDVSAHLVEN